MKYLVLKSLDVEIERKFLVDPKLLPPLPKGRRLTQGYLSDNPTVRVRVSDEEGKGWLTVKGNGGISREEFEFEHSSPADVDRLIRLMDSLGQFRISKTRYHLIGPDGLKWDVDQFHGPNLAGLWLGEVELTHPDQAVAIPSWATQEVTQNAWFTNASLGRHGLPYGYEHLAAST